MARSKNNKVVEEIVENINTSSLDQVMGDDYSIYAEDVIKNRALPDARDGLKPVQRRIIYSMYVNGYFFNKPTKKCTRIVGDVMGKFHPHGDSSIYEALARMAQDWKINMPLIDFQGNKGSVDGDGPAASRYTEARLSKLAEELVASIDKDTVDMTLNFDDTELEPTVLPAHFPNLFLNGSEGIAVAIATEIPPHNLRELIDAIIYRINHKTCSIDDLLQFLKGPDFPTGGSIYDCEELKNIYKNGKGRIEVISKYEIVEEKDKKSIIISEIPYKVVKKDLVYAIEKIKVSHEIDGILDVIDATEMHSLKIIVELKKDANAELILNYLLNKTDLRTYYSVNMYAIVNGRPQIMTLDKYIDTYIAHQVDVYTREFKFDLAKDKKRVNILNGLEKAISILDDVIKTIKASSNRQDVINNLMIKYGFDNDQAESIANLQLYRLSNTDITKIIEERDSLNLEIKELNSLLLDRKKLDRRIIVELKSISSRYSVDRKTNIIEKQEKIEINPRDLIVKEDVYVAITSDGYVKRSSLKSYKSSNSFLPGVKTGDRLVCRGMSNTINYILAFTNKGNYLQIPVDDIIEGKWKDEGKHINYLINLPFEEKIIKCLSVEEFLNDVLIVSITKFGQIKKTRLSEFYASRTSKPIQMMKMLKEDELVDVCFTTGNDNLMIFTTNGSVTYFNESELTIYGNKTSGVKSINGLKDRNFVIGLLNYKNNEKTKILLITDKGCKKIIDSSDIELTNRLGKISRAFKVFKSDVNNLVYMSKIIDKNEPFVVYMLNERAELNTIEITDFKKSKSEYVTSENISSKYTKAYIIDLENITKDIKIEKVYNLSEEDNGDNEDNKSKKNYSQVSIFEDFGD